MAGTANDYVGTLSETRAGYKCSIWQTEYEASSVTKSTIFSTSKRTPRPTRVRPFQQKRPYNPQEFLFAIMTTPTIRPTVTLATVAKLNSKHSQKYYNDSLYPDGSAKNASNYCRNPSRNIAGTWCYTIDISIPQDLCNVRDCEKSGKALQANILIQCSRYVFRPRKERGWGGVGRGDGGGERERFEFETNCLTVKI